MYIGIYEFASVVVRIESIYDYFHNMAKNYKTNKEAKYNICICEDDIKAEINNEEDKKFPMYYLETLAIYRKFLDIAINEGVFLFHSSSFMIDENAYIVTAPSGTGKSTHVRYLSEVYKERFSYINDDKPLIKLDNGDFYVYGSPWNGKHKLDNNVNKKLKAIFFLKRSEKDDVKKMNASNAFNVIYSQVHKPKGIDALKLIIDYITKLASIVSCYELFATNSVSSCEASGKVIDDNY